MANFERLNPLIDAVASLLPGDSPDFKRFATSDVEVLLILNVKAFWHSLSGVGLEEAERAVQRRVRPVYGLGAGDLDFVIKINSGSSNEVRIEVSRWGMTAGR